MSSAPKEQLSPMLKGAAWASVSQNASTVWPLSMRPARSVTVPEMRIGSRVPEASNISSSATRAALAFSESKIVSSRMRSTPPSIRASAASR